MRSALALGLMVMLFSAPAARAEIWTSLENYVHQCVVIVKAKAVGEFRDWREFAIVEVWTGSADALQLNDRGNYMTFAGEHGANAVSGQEIIFFFTRDNQPPNKDGKLSRHGTAFPITDGKLIYGSTSDEYRREYTVEELKRTVLAIAQATAD